MSDCLDVKGSTKSQALEGVVGIVQALAVWSKVKVLSFGHPKKITYHGLKFLEPSIERVQ